MVSFYVKNTVSWLKKFVGALWDATLYNWDDTNLTWDAYTKDSWYTKN